MQDQMSEPLVFFSTGWLATHYWVTFILIYLFMIYIYNKVFRVRKLPVLKNFIVYLSIAIGAFGLLIFQIDLDLPIVYCLGVVIVMMLMVRIRYLITGFREKKKGQHVPKED